MVHSLGDDHTIDYTQTDITQSGQQFDLILDTVAYRSVFDYLPILTAKGTYVLVGGATDRFFKTMLLGPWITKTGQIRGNAGRENIAINHRTRWQTGCRTGIGGIARAIELQTAIGHRNTVTGRKQNQIRIAIGFLTTNDRHLLDSCDPRSLGGDDGSVNLAAACYRCNLIKGARVDGDNMETGQRVPLFNLRIYVWGEHFAWADGGRIMVGLTVTGRVTIVALQLNNRPVGI
jgi:Zinc-binding dehydrogenase